MSDTRWFDRAADQLEQDLAEDRITYAQGGPMSAHKEMFGDIRRLRGI